MEKRILYYLCMAAMMTACSNNDLFEAQDDSHIKPAQEESSLTHAEKTLGAKIDANQDWALTRKSEVGIALDADLADIAEVQVLSANPFVEPATILAKHAPRRTGDQNNVVRLAYRAHVADSTLYAACVDEAGTYRVVPFAAGQTETVSFAQGMEELSAEARQQRRAAQQGTAAQFGIGNAETTVHADLFGWTDTKRTIARPPLAQVKTTLLKSLTDEAHSFLPEGKVNYDSVRLHESVRDNAIIEVDDKGGEVTVIFTGGSSNIFDRLGYYYSEGTPDVRSAKKFVIDRNWDPYNFYDVDYKTTPYTYTTMQVKLLYELPDGEFTTEFPANTKIGFFIEREYYADEDPVAFYGDGQLNSDLCQWLGNTAVEGHWDQTFAQNANRQRVVAYSVNGHNFLSCEDWTDWDFCDKMFHVGGAVKPAPEPTPVKPVKPQVWTYAFEDTNKGDYDMNDVILKVRENENDGDQIDVTLFSVGAQLNIWVQFADGTDLFGKEAHELFGADVKMMINTTKKDFEPITVAVDKPEGFDFQERSFRIMVKDDYGNVSYVSVANKGEEPHGIVIPADWSWPKERVCVTAAYPLFKRWCENKDDQEAQKWYEHPVEGNIIKF